MTIQKVWRLYSTTLLLTIKTKH